MSAGAEIPEIDRWLYSRLMAGTALNNVVSGRIYSELAPDNASYPLVRYDYRDAFDDYAINGQRNSLYVDYVVRCIDQGRSALRAGTVSAYVDALLHQAQGTVVVSGGTVLFVLSCVRQEALRFTEVEEGRRYCHEGGVYRIWAANA